MKKFKQILSLIILIEVVVIVVVSFAIKEDRKKKQAELASLWFNQYHVVAHAMGSIDQYPYTNSLEAFYANYEKGTRVFEVDFGLTSDQHLVLTHGWLEHKQQRLGMLQADALPMSLQEFKEQKIYGQYTPLDVKDLMNLMHQYPDIYVILDWGKQLDWDEEAKVDHIFDIEQLIALNQQLINEFKQEDETLLQRVIPQIYYEDHYYRLHEVYPFKHYIYTLYKNYDKTNARKVMQFITKNKIDVVTSNLYGKQAMITSEIKRQINLDRTTKASMAVFLHTINNLEEAKKYMEEGYKGMYSDGLSEADMKE